ncbi:MAG: Crp/Fnr family transcriptional regulator [Salibacteraceae bacterium]
MTSIKPFLDFAKERIELNEQEICAIEHVLPLRTFEKGVILLQEGEVSEAFYFILSGCIRMYYEVKGEEKSAFFYTEGDFVSSYESFINQQPAEHYLQCTEETTLVEISLESSEMLLAASPKFDAFARIIMEEELGHYQKLLASFITKSPEQRYLEFSQKNRHLSQRLPQRYIASFLGVSPESLSRIKHRIIEKERNS